MCARHLLESIYLRRLKKIVTQRVTVVKCGVDNRGSDRTGCFRIKVRTDTSELTNMRIAGQESDEISAEKVRSKIKPRLHSERVVLSEELLFETNNETSRQTNWLARLLSSKRPLLSVDVVVRMYDCVKHVENCPTLLISRRRCRLAHRALHASIARSGMLMRKLPNFGGNAVGPNASSPEF